MHPKPIRRLLVANRGEIARRVMRTCRAMGIETVAVFSDVDEDMPHVRDADVAVRLGPSPSTESYLRVDRLMAAARRTGADALHPGYGFLAENPALAEACEEAAILFVGPTPEHIRRMGSKREAKRVARAAGVPVVPGYDGAEQDPAVLAEEARKLGFPLLVKASAGGGGRGMRIVRDVSDLESAIEAARREAEASFGDGALLLERRLERARHVEVQVFGDAHGTVLHLGERDCSPQRRYQKVIEEAPSPAVDEELRARLGEAAVAVARELGYLGAGTVEFLLTPEGEFFFLEMNTRLQVEHPVTEEVTGLDLVRLQILVAEGRPLPLSQEEVRVTGAAIECRLYAEDPARDFLPCTGEIVDWHLAPGEAVRVESGVEAGTEVGPHYDSMLAKIVTRGDDRDEALRRMEHALRRLSVHGVETNRAFLLRALAHPELRAGSADTTFVAAHLRELTEDAPSAEAVRRGAIAATLFGHARRQATRMVLPHLRSGWRNSPFADPWVEYDGPGGTTRVTYRDEGAGSFRMTVGEWTGAVRRLQDPASVDRSSPELDFEIDGVVVRARVSSAGDAWYTQIDGVAVALVERPRFSEGSTEAIAGACTAPTPGRVVALRVAEGDRVRAGAPLVVMEAMKMEHTAVAPEDGIIQELHVSVGDQVDAGAVLAVVAPIA